MNSSLFEISPVPLEKHFEQAAIRRLSLCSCANARDLISFEQASKLKVLPLRLVKAKSSEILLVAAESDSDPKLEQTLKFLTNKTIELTLIESNILNSAIFRSYFQNDQILEMSAKELKGGKISIGSKSEPDRVSSPTAVPRFVSRLVEYAAAREASDIHIEPTKTGSIVKIRVDGMIYSHPEPICEKNLHDRIVAHIKTRSGMDTTQKYIPQDGGFQQQVGGYAINLRVSSMPTAYGEKIVLRTFGCRKLYRLADLELHPQALSLIEGFLAQSSGTALVVGPTGSGKTTLLYAILNRLRTQNANIVTIEDPIELSIDGIVQTELKENLGLNYENALRAAMRQDPDILMVGEIRDSRAAQLVLQASLTGHLVLSTLHSGNVFEALLRLSTLIPDAHVLPEVTSLIVAQRLIKKLCPECRSEAAKTRGVLPNDRTPLYFPTGCSNCHQSGYCGRVLATEVLKIDDELQDCLRTQGFDIKSLRGKVSRSNYLSFAESLYGPIQTGDISLTDIPSEIFERNI